MFTIYPAENRYTSDHGWLKTSHSFSFADYYDPNNLAFGPMRVLNDDFVQPSRGFGRHPHREMEIVSIVLKGQLQHTDSTGNTEILHPGDVQRMSAGTGVVHAEMNPSPSEEVNFLQLWFEPEESGLTPSYEEISYQSEQLQNRLHPIVSNAQPSRGAVAHIHQDMTIYLSEFHAGNELVFTQARGRRVFLFVIEGELRVQGEHALQRRDSARITEMHSLELASPNGAKFMLIDLP